MMFGHKCLHGQEAYMTMLIYDSLGHHSTTVLLDYVNSVSLEQRGSRADDTPSDHLLPGYRALSFWEFLVSILFHVSLSTSSCLQQIKLIPIPYF